MFFYDSLSLFSKKKRGIFPDDIFFDLFISPKVIAVKLRVSGLVKAKSVDVSVLILATC